MTELQEELADVIEDALEPHITRSGDVELSSQGIAIVSARAVEEWLVDRGLA